MKWIKALSVTNNDNNDVIRVGDKIKIYGEETTVLDFEFHYNAGIEKWETIILTTGRGDPLERSLKQIEIQQSWTQKPKLHNINPIELHEQYKKGYKDGFDAGVEDTKLDIGKDFSSY